MAKTMVIPAALVLSDAALKAEIASMAAFSYEDATAILEREYAGLTSLYVGRDAMGRMTSFFMTAWHELDVGGIRRPAVHLGLSATLPELKSSGRIAALYAQCVLDAKRLDAGSNSAAILWSTTVSPTVYRFVSQHLRDCEPKADGSFTEAGAAIAARLRADMLRNPIEGGAHPFVVKGIAKRTLYSEAERARISHVTASRNFTLFDQLGVKESDHDRMLFHGEVPANTALLAKVARRGCLSLTEPRNCRSRNS